MNKTIRMITAAALSVCMLAAASCSKKEPEKTTAPSSAAQTTAAPGSSETEAPASSENAPAPVIADNEQLEIIFKAKSTWFMAEDPEMLYTITDLDMNGLYEIISTKSGSCYIYEVKADKSGVQMADNDANYSCASSSYLDTEFALRMNDKGAYEFIAREYDDLGSDAGPKYVYYWRLSYSNGKLSGDIVATEIHEEDGKVWYGDDEFHMTPEEFKSVTDTSLPKITGRMKINWAKGQAVAGINDAKGLESICFKTEK